MFKLRFYVMIFRRYKQMVQTEIYWIDPLRGQWHKLLRRTSARCKVMGIYEFCCACMFFLLLQNTTIRLIILVPNMVSKTIKYLFGPSFERKTKRLYLFYYNIVQKTLGTIALCFNCCYSFMIIKYIKLSVIFFVKPLYFSVSEVKYY